MVKIKGPFGIGWPVLVHRCDKFECDVMWVGDKPYWKRSIPENGEANMCGPCSQQIVSLEEKRPRAATLCERELTDFPRAKYSDFTDTIHGKET